MIRYAKWVAAIGTAAAIVWFYLWWTAPPVAGVDGPERPRIPAGLAIAVAVSLLGWWSVSVMRIARSDDRSLRSRSMIAAFVLAVAPLLFSVFLIIFSNEVIGVWGFMLLGIPGLLGGLLIVLAGDAVPESSSKISGYLNESEKIRRIHLRRRGLWAIAGLFVTVGALLICFGLPFVGKKPEGVSKSAETSRSDNFTNIRGEFHETSHRSPLGMVGNCINFTGSNRTDVFVQKVDCGDKSAAYRIFQLAEQPVDCAADSDQRYAPRRTDEGSFILCLDYNWAHGLCIFPGGTHGRWHAVRDDCSSGGERPIEVQYDTTNAQGCATGGYPHQVRRFTICATQFP